MLRSTDLPNAGILVDLLQFARWGSGVAIDMHGILGALAGARAVGLAADRPHLSHREPQAARATVDVRPEMS